MKANFRPEHNDKKIDVTESWTLRYWCRELGVTERDLRETVEAVGPSVLEVKKILTRHH
jgi:hypothetical protein